MLYIERAPVGHNRALQQVRLKKLHAKQALTRSIPHNRKKHKLNCATTFVNWTLSIAPTISSKHTRVESNPAHKPNQ